MSEEMQIAKQWLAKATNDLLNADNNLAAELVPYDTVCFHCQQAAEKLLKAYLVGSGQSAPRTHDLLLILEAVLALDNTAEMLRDVLAALMPYAIEIRYPDDWCTPSVDDAVEARNAAGKVLTWLESAMPPIFSEPEGH